MVKRILIVDDEKGVAFFACENLAELGPGYHIEAATSGEEAIRKIEAQPFDMVISDFRMPGMNGLELLYRIQQRWPKTLLVLMTAYGNEQIRGAVERLRAFRYITKPFRMEDLMTAIRQAFTRSTPTTGRMTIFSEAQFEAISSYLEQINADSGAQAVLLCDATGQILAHHGETLHLNLNNLTALVAGGLNTTWAMSGVLGETSALNLNYHEGDRFHVYSSTINDQFFLMFLFDSRSQASRLGMVWLCAKRAIESLRRLTAIDKTTAPTGLPQEFGETLLEQMESWCQPARPEVSLQQATDMLAAEAEPQTQPSPAEPPTALPTPRSNNRVLMSFEDAVAQGLVSLDIG